MKKRNKLSPIGVGDTLILKCGTSLKVVDKFLNGMKFTVEDCEGNSRDIWLPAIRSGQIKWSDSDAVKINVGDSFILNCGVPVKVVSLENQGIIVVGDFEHNTKTTNAYSLKAGNVSWKEFGVPSGHVGSKPFKLGDKCQASNGTELTITEFINSDNVVVSDEVGNSKTTALSELRRNGLSWREFDKNFLRPKKDRYYVYIAKNNCTVLYVGKGKGGRYRHTVNGRSHVRELNRMYFSGETVSVEIFKDDLSEKEALDLEMRLIKSLLPTLNTQLSRAS